MNSHTKGFGPQTQKLKLRTIKQYHVKVLQKKFNLNGNTIEFHPQTQKLKLHTIKQYHVKVLQKRFNLNGNNTNSNVRNTFQDSIINSEGERVKGNFIVFKLRSII